MAGAENSPEHRELEPDAVLDRLQVGDHDALRGALETPQVDFKRGWYRLDDDHEKSELAKDVSGMANASGGIIVRGVATEKSPESGEEWVSEIGYVPREMANADQHRSVVKTWCYPQVRGIDFKWYPEPGGSGNRGIFVIQVPPQDEDDKWFIVTRIIDPDGKRVAAFAVAVRDGTHTDWLTPGQVHRDLSDGRRYRRLPARDGAEQAPTAGPEAVGGVSALLDEMEQFMGWGEAAGYYLAALPTASPHSRPDDFYAANGLFGALSKPPAIRWAGFGLSYEESPERIGADLVVPSARERCLWLRPDGLFAAGMSAKGEFMSWSYSRNLDAPQKVLINPVVLVEFTYLFSRFVWDELAPRFGSHWTYFVEIRGARDRPWNLALALRRVPPGERKPTGNDMAERIDNAQSPEADAYRLVAAVYDFFAANRQAIPYSDSEQGVIRPDELIAESSKPA